MTGLCMPRRRCARRSTGRCNTSAATFTEETFRVDMKLAGKTALVTGASSVGLGRAIALGLACEGVAVAITARRGDLLRQAAQEIMTASGHAPCVIEGDLYQAEAPARIAAEARAKLGRIDILVNAA